MKTQLILARALGYGCVALIVNQVVVAEATLAAESNLFVDKAARELSRALGVPLEECEVEVPDELVKWEWCDLLQYLPAVQEQVAKHDFVLYCWSEGGMHADTQDGPGDAWDEMCLDTEPPQAGTPYHILAPVHESSGDALDDVVRAKVLEDFQHWLNDRRMHDVSSVFHETVAMVASLIRLSRVLPNEQRLVEQVTMGVLGRKTDPAPGINWHCNRQWQVNDVRKSVRGALEGVGIIRPVAIDQPVRDWPEVQF